MKTIPLGFSLILIAASAGAQTAVDSRWSAWLGCWELLVDEVRESHPLAEAVVEAIRAGRPVNGRGARVCVAPDPTGGVVLSTLVSDKPVLEQTIVADGTDRPISDPECRGTQRAEWSKDGLLLFSRAELACPNQAPRTVSGLALLVANGQWVDVQAVNIESRDNVRVRRYRRAADQSIVTSRTTVPTRLTLEDVKEASAKVSPHVLEAALVETRARFALTGKALLDLDRAGVTDDVIDLIVALSYPQAFTVERVARDDRVTPYDYPFSGGWALGYPLWPYGLGDYYWSPYYYSPFGYSYLGSYPAYFGSSAFVVDTSARPTSSGRVVNGLGYTRVQPREAASGDRAGDVSTGNSGSSSRSGSGTVSTQGYSISRVDPAPSSGSSDGSSGGSSSGSSGGSSGGSGGSSSGGGGDGGRTAVDR